MKLKSLKVFNSVKVGKDEHIFLTNKDFELILKDHYVYIRNLKDGSTCVTPVTNTPWFVLELEEVIDEQVKSSKSPSRAAKAKDK